MIKSNSLRKYLITFFTFLMIGAGVCVLTSNSSLSAATCGAPGTCYGMRQNPPGGCGCYTNAEGCGGGCPGNPPNNPPACSPTAPVAGTLSTPANGATNLPKPLTLGWVNGAWGNGCPNTNYNRIFYKIKTADCNTLNSFSATAYFAGTTSHALNTELQWGTTYCWYVEQNNRADVNPAYSRFTSRREFTVSKIPTYTGGGFTGVDVCGNQSSGRSGSPGVTNPIEWTASYSNPEPANVMDWFIIAMIPTTGTYATNTDTVDWSTAYTKALQSGSFVFGINQKAGKTTYNNMQLGPVKWNPAAAGATDLNSANGRATLNGLGTNTSLTVNGNNATSKYTISFANSFTAGTYNVYVMTLVSNPLLPEMASNDATAASAYKMKKAGTWSVDTTPPTAALSVPTINADGTFNLNWSATDNVGISDLKSYVYSDVDGSKLHDNTTGIDITTQTTELSYPTPSNAGITPSNLGSKNYSDLSSSNGAVYNFKISVRDAACNSAEDKVKKDALTPWILGTNGDISGVGGISKTRIPAIANFTIPFTSSTGPAYFSQYGALSGNGLNATGTISNFGEDVTNYKDDAINSVHGANGLWFDDLLDKATKNQRTPVTNQAGKTISGSLAAGLGGIVDGKVSAHITGDLAINSNSQCDLRALVFVDGNLTINPDLTVTTAANTPIITDQIYNGCMFIVKGNVNIGTGTSKTNLATTSASLANYDIVNAFIITDGTFNVPVDAHGAGKKGDGLYINGGVISRNTMNAGLTTISRDINQQGNNLQPSTFFNLDPRYKLMFSEDFASRDYDIREFGL